MRTIVPDKLKRGAEIRVIAPSRSLSIVSRENIKTAKERLTELGFKVTFGKHVFEIDEFGSSSVQSRINDLHDAFSDRNVKAVLSAIGGYNANQLLEYIDFNLVKNNPKIFCGFSDINVLNNAIFKMTGLITYSGPHFSSWAMKKGFSYTQEYFKKACIDNFSFNVIRSKDWSDDPWYLNQTKRTFMKNKGFIPINKGSASGKIIGGHARCLAALQGTKYWPGFKNRILFVEEDEEESIEVFDRLIQSFIHQVDFKHISGIVIGRFQKNSNVKSTLLKKIFTSKEELEEIPILANVDFGHTTPIITYPVGGICTIDVKLNSGRLRIR